MDIQQLAGQVPEQGEYGLEGQDFITTGEQYLTFSLGQEQYAVDILCVEEIRSWEHPTRIPNAPGYVKGVINMRGIIVPIIDLRLKFGIGQASYTATTVVVVLNLEDRERQRTLGFVVDAVSDVLNAEESEIKPAPAFGSRIAENFVEGLVNVGEGVVTILNAVALHDIEPHAQRV